MISNLLYISDEVLEQLRTSVEDNVDRYLKGDFSDMASQYGWNAELKAVKVDHSLLATLQGGATTPEVEVKNSLIVHSALAGMSRAVAREERVWTRLTHVECLNYSRSRWLKGPSDAKAKIEKHFFAGGITQARDDNAISRLWWNTEIAKIACPDDPERGLKAILRTADTRLSFVERARIASRPALAQGIVRALETDSWLTDAEENFRVFMRVLNRNGGGVLFETMTPSAVDGLLATCSVQAQDVVAKAA